MNTKKVAVIIQHPMRSDDWRVDIYEVSEDTNKSDIGKLVEQKMLGPFEVIATSERISEYKFAENTSVSPAPKSEYPITTMSAFLATARAIMAKNGMSENTVLMDNEYHWHKHNKSAEANFRISFFVGENNGTCKQVSGLTPEIALNRMRLTFHELNITEPAEMVIERPETEIVSAKQTEVDGILIVDDLPF